MSAAVAATFAMSLAVRLTGVLSPRPLLTVTMREGGCRIINRCVHQSLSAVVGVFPSALGGCFLACGIGYAA